MQNIWQHILTPILIYQFPLLYYYLQLRYLSHSLFKHSALKIKGFRIPFQNLFSPIHLLKGIFEKVFQPRKLNKKT